MKIPTKVLVDYIVEKNLIPSEIALNYTAVEGFDEPNGKFPNTLGNVALVDCHYVLPALKETLQNMFDNIEDSNPLILPLTR